MKSPNERQNGMVAILDALGATDFGEPEIQRFMISRDLVLQALREKAEIVFSNVDPEAIATFTLNDTVIITLITDGDPQLKDAEAFFKILRRFIADSLTNNILFRGAVSIGTFYLSKSTHTVMGQAVTDAAPWYEMADWIGVHATPRSNLIIEDWQDQLGERRSNFIVDWDVPLVNGRILRTKVVNWPRLFVLPHGPFRKKGKTPRQHLLNLLINHLEPKGTESKYINTLAFFDADVTRYAERHTKKRK
jgi:hypothetical protein